MARMGRNGQHVSARLRFEDLYRVGPGTLAGRYLRRFWQPVYRLEDLPPGRALPLRIMGEDLTLYRGADGAPHAVAFRCAHRGTQLSIGFVEGDCLRCRYHGWTYDATGQCVEMPAEAAAFPAKVRIRGYPTTAYLGLAFVYLGDGEPPPFPRFAEFEALAGEREVLRPQVWPCNFLQRLDNNDDSVHVVFTHGQTYLADRRRGMPEVERWESAWGTTSLVRYAEGATQSFQFGMPNVFYFRLPGTEPDVAWDERIQWMVPVDDEHTTEFRVRLVPVTGEAAERYRAHRRSEAATEGRQVTALGEAILSGQLWLQDLEAAGTLGIRDLITLQDFVTQVGQGRVADRRRERLGRSDSGVIVFRQLWERELRALAADQPLKAWTRPAALVPSFSPAPSGSAIE
jgi:5,5'-dehydrodivanillate O-demethylase oxygenase subunit